MIKFNIIRNKTKSDLFFNQIELWRSDQTKLMLVYAKFKIDRNADWWHFVSNNNELMEWSDRVEAAHVLKN